MDSQPRKLHIVFFPYLVHGHMIPTIDMARVFARHGVKVSIVFTPQNASYFSKTIERDRDRGHDINILTIKFPYEEAGLPEGCEDGNSLHTEEMLRKFQKATTLLQKPLEQILKESRPNCIVADMMFPWATEAASSVEIPRLVFHGMCCSALSMFHSLMRYKPYKNIESDSEPFTVPGLPDQIHMTRLQLPSYLHDEHELARARQIFESDVNCYGVLLNSFYELEPAYIQHYREVMGRKAWQIGPVSLCNRDNKDKARRGGIGSIDTEECLGWLALKEPNSVLYICFGSRFCFSAAQFSEIAMALEVCGQSFIWVVNEGDGVHAKDKKPWLPEGFEKKMEGKGLIIRGWAPQVLILDHEAVGGFMTHCGWNSTLEGIAAGVPLITWPLQAEQFCNEKLVTDVLRIGVGVGAQEWSRCHERKILLRKEDIGKALTRLMVGDEAEEYRNRAKALKEMAQNAIEDGGSSYSDLEAFLEEISARSVCWSEWI